MGVRVALLVAVGAIAVPTLSSPASTKAGQPVSGYPWQQRIHNAVEFLHTRTGSARYRRVGPGGLVRVARRAGMRRFVPNPVWGGCQVTARDQARFFFRIRSLIPPGHREYAMGLLRRIVSYERWGIPRGSPPGWRVYFKGGWFKDNDGWRVHPPRAWSRESAILPSPSPSSPAAARPWHTGPRRSPV